MFSLNLILRFLYIDLFIIIPIAVTSELYIWVPDVLESSNVFKVGRTLPYPKIHPKRPTASLVSRKVLISIIGQILINAAIQVFVFVWVRKQSWYTKPDTNVDKLETFNFENSALFLVSCFQYILVAGVFSVGPPYRKPLYTNREFHYVLTEILKTELHLSASLVICLVGLTSFSTYILLSPAKSIALILDIINFNFAFKLQLLAIAAVNILASFAFEKFAERPISRLIVFAKRWKGRRGKRRDYRSLPSTGN